MAKQYASVVSPTAATFYFYKSFWSVLRSQALEIPQLGFRELNGRKSCWTWPGSAPKPPRPSPEPCWTWPTCLCTKASRNLLRNLLRNPVEPDRPGSAPKPPRPSPEPSEPFPEPRWTWPGACTSAHRNYSGLKTPLAYAVGETTPKKKLRISLISQRKKNKKQTPDFSLMFGLSSPWLKNAKWPLVARDLERHPAETDVGGVGLSEVVSQDFPKSPTRSVLTLIISGLVTSCCHVWLIRYATV